MSGNGVGAGTSSTCGSYFNPGNRDFPAVPFSHWDFNDGKCRTGSGDIENYNDPYQVIKEKNHSDWNKELSVPLIIHM